LDARWSALGGHIDPDYSAGHAVVLAIYQHYRRPCRSLAFALQESSEYQCTLGKRVLKIYVTDLEGRRISFGQATGRHFGKIVSAIILGIGYIMAGFTEKKQGLHDMMAGTLVKRR
jgi:uncharacterized RDD family membrane protein YckC